MRRPLRGNVAHIFTELNRAASEANSGFVNLASRHIANAENLVSALRAKVRLRTAKLGKNAFMPDAEIGQFKI